MGKKRAKKNVVEQLKSLLSAVKKSPDVIGGTITVEIEQEAVEYIGVTSITDPIEYPRLTGYQTVTLMVKYKP